jgi:hypothetical protein
MWLVATRVGGNTGGAAMLRLTAGGLAGVAAYVIILAVLRAPELQALRRRLSVRPAATGQ